MLDALSACALPPADASPVVLMVSGGSDSVALLVRAARSSLDLCDGAGSRRLDPGTLHVLHVNHCLRGAASDGDEAFVVDVARRLGVPCTVARVDVGALVAAGENLEEAARLKRYELAWDLAAKLARAAGVDPATARIAVAHTADDRAETFLMRVLAGAGTTGLTGMRARRGIVVRPLLGQTRAELRSYLHEQGIGWREDATNADTKALRSYVRHEVTPSFVGRNPAFPRTLAGMLDVMADEDDLLERLAAELLAVARRPGSARALVLDAATVASAEPALARRALRQALVSFLGEERAREARFEARHIESLLALARQGGSASLPLALDARRDRTELVVSEPDGRSSSGADVCTSPVALPVPGTVRWGDARIEARLVEVPADEPNAPAWARTYARAVEEREGLREGRDFVLADAARLGVGAGGALEVGAPQAGERMRPLGMTGSKLLSDVISQARVPVRDRAHVPVVRACDGADAEREAQFCVWVGGIRLDARAAYKTGTHHLVELRFYM